jgi:hypothetical protein
MDNSTQFWDGDCVPSINLFHISFSTRREKWTYCQTDLCNLPYEMEFLETSILCSDGFYN